MGPALPASPGPRTWDGGQVPCEGRPETRWSGQAPSREPRGRSRFRPADCVRTKKITLDIVSPIQGGRSMLKETVSSVGFRMGQGQLEAAQALGFEIRNPQRFAHNMARLVEETGKAASIFL